MSATVEYPVGRTIQTGFNDWVGSPPHLFGKFVGRPVQPWAFDEVYADTGLVIVREDLFEGTVGVPYSFKTHNPGQVIATFTLEQLAHLAVSNGTSLNAVMNGIMPHPVVGSHPDFILGARNFYNTWRIRAINRHRDTGQLLGRVVAGGGVGPNGISLSSNFGITSVYGNPPTYYWNIEVNINLPPGNIFAPYNFQVEVGFGGVANAVATATVLTASPEWPAYTQSILTTTV